MDTEKERFSVTLKHSLVSSSDAAYLQSLFKDLELAEKLRYALSRSFSDCLQRHGVHLPLPFCIYLMENIRETSNFQPLPSTAPAATASRL